MRLLFIAPDSNLQTQAEFMRIARDNLVDPVTGTFDREGLARALEKPADAVHFASHGARSILSLNAANTELLDAVDLVSMLSAQRCAAFFFLNACNSLGTATAIHNSLHVPVIAHEIGIDDPAAIEFATVFYRRFKQTQNVKESFDAGVTALMRRFPEQAAIPCLINGDMTTDQEVAEFMTYVKDAIDGMNDKLNGIEVMVNGLRSQQSRTLFIMLGLLLLAQLATPWLSSLFAH